MTAPANGAGDRWPEIDEHIVNHRILPALMILRRVFGYGIPEAIDAFDARYRVLRETRPDDFTVSREEYGRHVYS
ncbi:hypothetical protein BKA00_004320 [Actinomadura coerulea]|uniref:Uncharacterized protein n=1 Tax=Actinomadura coerulea TaxID=46159 RepID=A0A7X0G2V5_9ACTN|nr:hypothetical protein [Actinomadura coerulea]MBB6397406.1 hypothetical protein [Actinomadura coerulea]GGQ02417.1 hypothetical protein GCM10010187_17710 [Actinomadura coerulea]